MRILGLIPVRGGSKGIPNKNSKLLFGKPLMQYTAEAALKASQLDILIVGGGFLAFAISIAGGIFAVKLYNLFAQKKINPLIFPPLKIREHVAGQIGRPIPSQRFCDNDYSHFRISNS